MAAYPGGPSCEEGGRSPLLSKRELEVARLVARGFSNPMIAERLFRSPATVATHVAHILDKLGMRSRAEIGAWMAEQAADRDHEP